MKVPVILFLSFLISFGAAVQVATAKQNPIPQVSSIPAAQAAFKEGVLRLGSHHYRQAISFFSMAIASDKNIAAAYSNRAVCYSQLEQWEPASKDINQALAIDPRFAGAYHLRADLHFQNHELAKSIEDMSKACQLEPNYATHFYSRGKLYEIAEKNDKAEQDYRRCLEIKDNGTNAAFRLGNLEMKLGRFAEAAAHFTRYIHQHHPEDLEASYLHRALCYEKLGKMDLAQKDRTLARSLTENGWGEIFRPQK